MAQSVVIYWPADVEQVTMMQIQGLLAHFKLLICVQIDATKRPLPPDSALVITPRHAFKQSQSAGAQYMGREFALKKAGLL